MTTTTALDLDELCVNTIRTLAMDAVEKANSGHPGTPMEAASLAYVLWTKQLRFNPKNPSWPGRDRFVLSAGHASMLLYSMLHLTGFDIGLDELKSFRQLGSRTPGHPERHPEIGIETTTGPLGQGFGNGVGMAIAQRYIADMFSRPGFEDLFDHNIYAFCSDGDMQEGISHEAAAIAGHLKLGKLIYVYLDNKITIEGSTELSMSENVALRYEAYGWHVQKVSGEDRAGILKALEKARANTDKPSIIIARTHIAIGSPNKHDTADAHGAPLGADEVALTKENLSWPTQDAFHIPSESLEQFRRCIDRGSELESAWTSRWNEYKTQHPEAAAEFERIDSRTLPQGWDSELPVYPASKGGLATRNASGDAINAIAAKLPELIGGSADLAPSNNTHIKGATDFEAGSTGPNLHFGIREHGMGSILNGIAFSSGLIPFGATFLIFSDYMRPTIRLAALSEDHVIYVYTHDSIGLGEDGPTHQPIEQLASLRAIPNLTVIRPSDANETVEAWRVAIGAQSGPVAIVLTRQKIEVIDRERYAPASMLSKGAYVLADAPNGRPEVIIIATGSEVEPAFAAQQELVSRGVAARIVAMPSWELFAKQPADYRESVLPSAVRKRVSVEAASPMGWERWVGIDGLVLGIDRFGDSAPGEVLMKSYGFTSTDILNRVAEYISQEDR